LRLYQSLAQQHKVDISHRQSKFLHSIEQLLFVVGAHKEKEACEDLPVLALNLVALEDLNEYHVMSLHLVTVKDECNKSEKELRG